MFHLMDISFLLHKSWIYLKTPSPEFVHAVVRYWCCNRRDVQANVMQLISGSNNVFI